MNKHIQILILNFIDFFVFTRQVQQPPPHPHRHVRVHVYHGFMPLVCKVYIGACDNENIGVSMVFKKM